MESWTAGYISDINYTYGFYREMTPALLALTALLKAQRAPDPNGPLTYCELGCGQGLSVNLLASANPAIQFHATDFNPSQVVGAKTLAAEADIGNVHFYDESFADFADAPGLPAGFDIIVLHGIYSWISAENRAAIVEFIRRKLKVGGLVYMSYNALPGWASAMPMRRLFVDHAESGRGATSGRVEAALQFAERVMLTKARFFMANPPVVDRFDRLKMQNRNYLAHEYFNRDWTPFYAADVFEEMSPAKLSFLGSAALLDHIDAINISAEQKELLQEINDPGRRETVRDFMVNQQFRRDVFQKGSAAHSLGSAREAWLNQRFALSVPRVGFDMTVKGPGGEATLQEDIYAPLLDIFATGPKTLREVIGNRAIDATAWLNMQQACLILVGAGRLEPCLQAKDENKRVRSTRAFNHAVMARARESADLQFLASPVTGGGIAVPRFHQLFLLALQNGKKTPDEWAEFAWKALAEHGQAIIKQGATLQTAEENVAELKTQAAEFAEKQLPVLKGLQVI